MEKTIFKDRTDKELIDLKPKRGIGGFSMYQTIELNRELETRGLER